MSTYRDKAIVLRVRPLKEADRQYIIYTERHGKVSLIARGAKKCKSKMSPHLGAFGVAEVMVAHGRKFDRLAGASLVSPTAAAADSAERSSMTQAFFACADALTRRDQPDARIFSLLAGYLDALAVAPPPAVGTRPLLFDCACSKLFDLLGVGLELAACVRCRGALVPDGNGVNVVRGGVECASCHDGMSLAVSSGAIKTLRYFRSESLRSSSALRVPPQVRREVSFLIDLLLSDHLDARAPVLRYLHALTA